MPLKIETSEDGVSWALYKDPGTASDIAEAQAKHRFVRDTWSDDRPRVSLNRVGKCKVCQQEIAQQATHVSADATPDHLLDSAWRPDRCKVCASPLDRPTRAGLVGAVVESTEIDGSATIRFKDGRILEIGASGYGGEFSLDVELE